MSKFHINKHGVPDPCRAKKGNCPLGGNSGDENHYATIEEAQEAADRMNEREYGLLVQAERVESLAEKINNIKSIEEDLSKDMPNLKPDLNNVKQRYDYDRWKVKDVEKVKSMDKEEFKAHLMEKYRVNITDLDNTTQDERSLLGAYLVDTTLREIGNVVGFLNSEKNVSYSDTKEYSKEPLSGSYQDVLSIVKMTSNVGWHKDGSMAMATENTSLNVIMDKKGLQIAGDIARYSEKNKESRDYPASGLIYSVQALRLKGWDEKQIKNVAIDHRLDKVVYEEYNTKPRNISGASELGRVLNRTGVEKNVPKALGWDIED